MEQYRGYLCFDGDDTLWFNTYKYHLPMIWCAEIICSDLGVYSFHPRQLLEIYNTNDLQGVKEQGFDKNRFPSSWIKTYRQLCSLVGKKPKKVLSSSFLKLLLVFGSRRFRL